MARKDTTEFIGKRFGKQNQIEVLEFDSKCGHDFKYIVKCHICAEDTEVYGDGTFLTLKGGLIRGQVPCGCTLNPRYTEAQMLARIKRKADEIGAEFIGFLGAYSGVYTKLNLVCCNGHVWNTNTACNFMRGIGCIKCAKYGFNPERDASMYIFKIVGEDAGFTGYGVTCNFSQRLTTHRYKLKEAGMSIEGFRVFPLSGEQAICLEECIQERFPVIRQEIEGFKTEATYLDLYDKVVLFIEDKLKGFYEHKQD